MLLLPYKKVCFPTKPKCLKHPGGLFPTPSVTVPAPAVAPNPRLETSQFERLVADGFDPGMRDPLVFIYVEKFDMFYYIGVSKNKPVGIFHFSILEALYWSWGHALSHL